MYIHHFLLPQSSGEHNTCFFKMQPDPFTKGKHLLIIHYFDTETVFTPENC